MIGPAYFVSNGGAKFPELIVVLQGYAGVTIVLHGETFISQAGVTSSTFATVPDVPVGTFELTLPEGPDSALGSHREPLHDQTRDARRIRLPERRDDPSEDADRRHRVQSEGVEEAGQKGQEGHEDPTGTQATLTQLSGCGTSALCSASWVRAQRRLGQATRVSPRAAVPFSKCSRTANGKPPRGQ